MRVLFDQGTPVPLRQSLSGHSISTAYELGWATLTNGELLRSAEEQGFEVIVKRGQGQYIFNLEEMTNNLGYEFTG